MLVLFTSTDCQLTAHNHTHLIIEIFGAGGVEKLIFMRSNCCRMYRPELLKSVVTLSQLHAAPRAPRGSVIWSAVLKLTGITSTDCQSLCVKLQL